MKTILALAAIALLTGVARADWKDLKPGMDYRAAMSCAGIPLLENRGKGGAEVWTYDCRGYIQFQSGRVTYWEASKPPKPAAVAVAKAAKPSPPALRLPGKAVVAKD